ncbi:MAG: ferrous iron transport protein A [Clostridiales bacterium]|nr:ferrous iron transport protein A [Clostridiales bacterium]
MPYLYECSLSRLPLGEEAVVCDILSDGPVRRRLMDLGLVAGTRVRALFRSPSGDPVAYEIRGAVIALREEQASRVTIRLCPSAEAAAAPHAEYAA